MRVSGPALFRRVARRNEVRACNPLCELLSCMGHTLAARWRNHLTHSGGSYRKTGLARLSRSFTFGAEPFFSPNRPADSVRKPHLLVTGKCRSADVPWKRPSIPAPKPHRYRVSTTTLRLSMKSRVSVRWLPSPTPRSKVKRTQSQRTILSLARLSLDTPSNHLSAAVAWGPSILPSNRCRSSVKSRSNCSPRM